MPKRLVLLWTLLRSDARQLWRALRHPASPAWLKWAVAGLALYLLSPVDLLPDFIPILGLVDDLVLIPLAIRFLLGKLPAHVKRDIDGRTVHL
jgi:uncharacterized membrane protein YkvA (DUF1232 family)